MLEALIFDVDGTLADTERWGHRVAFNRAFAEVGLDWNWDEELYGDLLAVTGGKERMRHFIDRCRPEVPVDESELPDFIAHLQVLKTRHYKALVEQGGIPARPGVLRLIEQARELGIRLAIATTTTPGNVDALLAASFGNDAKAWFEVIGAGDIVPKKKPAPDIYQYVLGQLDLAPERCLALEDSEMGLTAALAAGIPTVVTINGYTADHDFTGALMVVDHLGEPGQQMHCLHGAVPLTDITLLDVVTLSDMHDAWLQSVAQSPP